jgi:hypothetical protein
MIANEEHTKESYEDSSKVTTPNAGRLEILVYKRIIIIMKQSQC